MGQVTVNSTGQRWTREAVPGFIPGETPPGGSPLPGTPEWFNIEPNETGQTGATITTTPRNPVSPLRQNRKGSTTRLEAGRDNTVDATLQQSRDWAPYFLYAAGVNEDLLFRGADATATGYTVPSLTAEQATKLVWSAGGLSSLLHAIGYGNPLNNSPQDVKVLTADPVATDTELQVAGLAVETAPANAEVEVCGVRGEPGDLSLVVNPAVPGFSQTATITSAGGVNFTELGLSRGQRIHWGGLTDANRGSALPAAAFSYGSMRIRDVTATTIVADKLDSTVLDTDGTDDNAAGAPVAIDILFGQFVRNVASDDPDFEVRTAQFETSLPNLFQPEGQLPIVNPDGFLYDKGQHANNWTLNMGLGALATSQYTWVGLDSDPEVDNSARKANADQAIDPIKTGALNTAADFFRLRVARIDDEGLSTDLRDTTVNMTNDASPEEVLGLLGARYVNQGNFGLAVTSEIIFNLPGVTAAIRENETVTMDWLLRNDDGAMAFDVPSCTLGNGVPTFEQNVSVRRSLEVAAFVDSFFLFTLGVSFFPVYPAAV